MIKLISVVLQMLLLKKSFSKVASPFEYIERTGEKARGYFLFTLGCLVATLFLVISFVVAVIEVGLQIEKHGSLSFSGLMISASIFLGISIFLYVVSSIVLVIQKQKMLDRQRQHEQETASKSHITPLIEEILKQVLMNLSEKKKANDSSAADESFKKS